MTNEREPWQTGDFVMIACDGKTMPGAVMLSSPNGNSLMLSFDGMLNGHLLLMPALRGDDGVFRAITTGAPVALSRMPEQ
jgi:hypothetical protein